MFELLFLQTLDPVSILLGPNFTKLGLRKLDRDLNTCIEQFQKYTKQYVLQRIDELEVYYKRG